MIKTLFQIFFNLIITSSTSQVHVIEMIEMFENGDNNSNKENNKRLPFNNKKKKAVKDFSNNEIETVEDFSNTEAKTVEDLSNNVTETLNNKDLDDYSNSDECNRRCCYELILKFLVSTIILAVIGGFICFLKFFVQKIFKN
ncbi:hypothetical protein HERIO_367 [Hepatospora eriocheir]|uniref:Uncharacterized protein n=1 Tax=Hepatospora eriocheir TaxID=1081669 RepID=A0A1X0QDA6_9MICR|nr:hypothetical protein HERIO_367 [Hepatospora eriocheir]